MPPPHADTAGDDDDHQQDASEYNEANAPAAESVPAVAPVLVYWGVVGAGGICGVDSLLLKGEEAIQHGNNGLPLGGIGALCCFLYKNLAVRAGPRAEEVVVDRESEVLVGVVVIAGGIGNLHRVVVEPSSIDVQAGPTRAIGAAVDDDSAVAEGQAEKQADKDCSIQHQVKYFKSKKFSKNLFLFFYH